MFSLKTALSSLLVLFAGCDRGDGTSAHAAHEHAPTTPEVITSPAIPSAEAIPTVEAKPTAEAITVAVAPRALAEARPPEVKSARNRAAKKVGRAEYVCPMHPDVVSDKPGLCPDPSSPAAPEGAPAPVITSAPPATAADEHAHHGHRGHAHGAASMSNADNGAVDADAADAVYTCPMHPEVTSSAPGNCPQCGMNLVPKK